MTTRTFHPTTDQVPAARRFVREAATALGAQDDTRVLEDLLLLTSEAVTNAVVHAGTDIDVAVSLTDASYLVAVHDDASARIPGPLRSTPAHTDGRGLAIIAAVADRWGVDHTPGDGKTIWFVVSSP